jgi:hypothetical protein
MLQPHTGHWLNIECKIKLNAREPCRLRFPTEKLPENSAPLLVSTEDKRGQSERPLTQAMDAYDPTREWTIVLTPEPNASPSSNPIGD